MLSAIVADMMGRTVSFSNEKGELIAVMTKTSKALIMNAAFGGGSESTIDIAPGVDCTFILSVVFGYVDSLPVFAEDSVSGHRISAALHVFSLSLTIAVFNFTTFRTWFSRLQQVGAHFALDVFNSYMMDPMKDAAVGSVVETAGLEGVVGDYTNASNQMLHSAHQLTRMARFMNENFFQ